MQYALLSGRKSAPRKGASPDISSERLIRKYGYPPDKQETATRTVLEQAEVLSAGWAD